MQNLFRAHLLAALTFALVFVACEKKPNSSAVSLTLGSTSQPDGLFQLNTSGDGRTEPAQAGGKDCQQLVLKEGRSDAYLYLGADGAFKKSPLPSLTLTVEYFDAVPATFSVDYDSAIEGKNGGGYTPSKERIQTKGLQEWQKAKFVLDRPQLAGRQNDHADFRLRVGKAADMQFFVRAVTLSKD
jgi:hypothetical protein